MNARDRHRLLERAVQAQFARAEAESHGRSPRTGDVFGLPATAELSVLWAWIDTTADGSEERAVLVAADLHPGLGSADLAAPPGASCGAVSLRCAVEIEMPVDALQEAILSGSLPMQTLESARLKRAQVADGTLRGSRSARDMDGDPQYRDWMDEGPRQAQALLVQAGAESQHNRSGQPHSESRQAWFTTDAFNTATGMPWMPSTEARSIVAQSLDEAVDPALLQLLQHAHRAASQPHLGVDAGAAGPDAKHRGWGVVVPSDASPETLSALQPLIEHRRRRLGEDRVRIFEHRPGEDWRGWLARHGAAPGQVDPSKVPYYLLIVASPRRISFEFQRILGVEYGVGRLHFESVQELARYAQGVVAQERRGEEPEPRRAVVFAPSTVDPAGEPLDLEAVSSQEGWQVQRLEGEEAGRERLLEAMRGAGEPALRLLVAVTEGWVGSSEMPIRRDVDGALRCHRDPASGAAEVAEWVTASDVDGARVEGSVLVLLAAHSVGMPGDETGLEPRIAALPQCLLAHPAGGADAVIGRVGPGWRRDGASQHPWLADLVGALVGGLPVGLALQQLRTRYASLATELAAELDRVQMGARHDPAHLAGLWTERNNLRDLVVLGDPAARLTSPKASSSTSENSHHAS